MGMLLEIQRLCVGYGAHTVLEEVTLSLQAGEIAALIGPNGVGKSTLLKTLSAELRPLSGEVLLMGLPLERLSETERAKRLAIVSTQRVHAPLLRCRELVALGRYPYTGRLGLLDARQREKVQRAMELVGVEALSDREFSQLSDGQRQRVLLARALCQEPQLLLLDEPTSFLDVRHKLEFMNLLRCLAREQNIGMLLSLHELELARNATDRVVCLRQGRVDRVGAPREVLTDGYIEELYGMEPGSYSRFFREEDPPAQARYVRSGTRLLRCGVSSGSCAAMAARGAAELLLLGRTPTRLSLRTPGGYRVEAEALDCRLEGESARCAVRKDAGDDPDVTDGCLIVAQVDKIEKGIRIDGGEGVGRVTRPGLDQCVGAAAINSVPREMIAQAVRDVLEEAGSACGLAVTISVPGGEELARRTFNPMLGIEGGISILGTSGIVEPMSQQALVDSTALEIRQAAAQGVDTLVLLLGNYGAAYLREEGFSHLESSAVKCSNFIGEAVDAAAAEGFSRLLLVGHIGKMVKLAGGIMNTHSRQADCRAELFTAHAALCGADSALCRALMEAVTADACLELLQARGLREKVVERLLDAMQRQLTRRCGETMRAGVLVFSKVFGTLGFRGCAQEVLAEEAEERRGG